MIFVIISLSLTLLIGVDADGWFLGDAFESCESACHKKGLICSEADFRLHQTEVDSSDEVLNLIKNLGGSTSATSCESGNFAAVPLFTNANCMYWASITQPSAFSCTRQPGPKEENKRRICYCKSKETTASATTTAEKKPSEEDDFDWDILDDFDWDIFNLSQKTETGNKIDKTTSYSLITNCKHFDCDWNCDWDVNCDDCYRNGLSNCIREDVESVDDCQAACSNFDSCVGFDYRGDTLWKSCLLYPSSPSGSKLFWYDCPSGYYLAENFYIGEGFSTQIIDLTTATTSNDLVAQNETGHSCYAKISD